MIDDGQVNLWKNELTSETKLKGGAIFIGSGTMIRGVNIRMDVYSDALKMTLQEKK